jgi:hypothetical protein
LRDATGALRGIASATASSSSRISPSAAASSVSACARERASMLTRSRSSWSSVVTRQLRALPAGSNLPAATSRIPSNAAPDSRATLGCRSSRVCARVSTGSAARIGSATVRRSSLNSTTPSRGGSAARNVAGPVTGTKLKSGLPSRRTAGPGGTQTLTAGGDILTRTAASARGGTT